MPVPLPGQRPPAAGRLRARLVWDRSAWEYYRHWQTTDHKVLTRINTLIDAALRDPFEGIGKPGQLKYGAAGAWSRRITEEHRLVYLVDGEDLIILQVRYHY
ncbi:Txe/YoeB family addiction module toxin [Micrococcus luteus]|nr:Txe/YoeB family addiction module toxin [Micrococcus luteus]